MIVPPPLPTYTLAPGVPPLTRSQERTLEACLRSLSGHVAGVMVLAARTTATHEILHLETRFGPLLVMEQVTGPSAAVA